MANRINIDAGLISRFKKEKLLLSMTEKSFRDQVIRPLFFRKKLADGRDFCGQTEKGKDAIFIATDQLGINNVYVVQTKKGKLTLSKDSSKNIITIITQLRTALETPVFFIAPKEKKFPIKVILCTSGKINESARKHIVDEIKNPRLEFMDSDDLIPNIDRFFPELWFGIDTEIFPYFATLKQNLETASDNILISDLIPGSSAISFASDKMFVQLHLYRTKLVPKKIKGQVTQIPKFEEFPITGVINRKEKLFLILGDAGSGKSTSLKRLAYILASKGLESQTDFKIPILLRALEIWGNNQYALVEICDLETKRLINSKKSCFSTEDLFKGNVIILIDALDELADENARNAVLEKAIIFNKNFPECKIIITSRDNPSIRNSPKTKGFGIFKISPINYKQAEQIIKRLQKESKLPTEISQEVLRRIQDIHGMALNPLLVTVFAATTEYSRKDIPANITELFKKYTELMLGRWEATKGLGQQYHAPLKDFILRQIAYKMHSREITNININEFTSIVNKELLKRGHKADIPQLINEIVNRSGLFHIFDDRIEFRHLLLQEFYAGRGIPATDNVEILISNEWWQRAIVFYFGENPSDSHALHSIVNNLNSRPIEEIFTATLTLGLALQACYLVEVTEKTDVLKWVIERISEAKEPFLRITDKNQRFPISRFLDYYLFGRDSVACNILEDKAEEIKKSLQEKKLPPEQKELNDFWIIVGLLESGLLKKAEMLIKKFKPKDTRLLLAIHLGCFIIQNLRVTTQENQKIAARISESLSNLVQVYRKQILQEFKTELLEVRRGQIEAIELPSRQE